MSHQMTDAEFIDLANKAARDKWASSAGLRGEFKTADEYASFVMAAGSGNVVAAADGWAKEWRATNALQAEFPDAETYVAFKKHEVSRRR